MKKEQLRRYPELNPYQKLVLMVMFHTGSINEEEIERIKNKTVSPEMIEAVLTTLKPREATVLTLRYGLKDGKPKRLEEIGRTFSITRDRVSQIETKAIEKLRHPSQFHFLLRAIEQKGHPL